MKKKVLALLLATAMISTFVACGEEKTSANDNAGDTTVEDTTGGEDATGGEVQEFTVTVWSPSEDQAEENGKWLQTQCDNFAKAHPEWKLEFKFGTCPEGSAKDEVTKDIGKAADVFCFANDNLADLVAAGAIAELGGTTADFVKNNFGQTFVDSVTIDGSVYGVPYDSNTWFMYYDKSVFSEEDVKSLEVMLDKGVVSFPLEDSWYNASFYLGAGAEFFGGVNDNDAGINLGGEKAVAATKYIIDLTKDENFKNGKFEEVVSSLGSTVSAAFGGTWNRDAAEEKLGDNFAVAPAPTVTIDDQVCQLKAFAGSKAYGVKAESKCPEVATALAVYLASADAQKARYETRGTVPVINGVADMLADDPVVGVIGAVYDGCSVMQPYCANMGNWWNPATNFMKDLLAGGVTHENAEAKVTALENKINGDN